MTRSQSTDSASSETAAVLSQLVFQSKMCSHCVIVSPALEAGKGSPFHPNRNSLGHMGSYLNELPRKTK